MKVGWFNWRYTLRKSSKKSNLKQWKIRGAIDTSMRFMIASYSWLFSTALYGTFTVAEAIKKPHSSVQWHSIYN